MLSLLIQNCCELLLYNCTCDFIIPLESEATVAFSLIDDPTDFFWSPEGHSNEANNIIIYMHMQPLL